MSESKKIVIIGGGGGASNAANVMRSLSKDVDIRIFTNRGEIGNLPCEIPFVLKGMLPSWESSFAFKDKFYRERNIEVHLNTEVTGIDREQKKLTAGGISYDYDKIVLDLGAIPDIPGIPGLDGYNEFTLSTGLAIARDFEKAIPQYTKAAVIGVGQIGLEVAAILKAKSYSQIYLMGRSRHILRAYLDEEMAAKVQEKIAENGVGLILSAGISKIQTSGKGKLLSLADRDIEVDFVFIASGRQPNTKLAQMAGIKIGETGAIAVNEYLQTSDPDIYAIGDCMENRELITGSKINYQTAANAARTGRIAGKNIISGNVAGYTGTVMVFITEVFGYEVGTVGLTENQARAMGFDVVSSLTTSSTRRRPFGGKQIDIKLIADRKTRTLVGAQIIGEELVAGKIDRLAVAVSEKIPVAKMSLIDTCYSPTTGAGFEAVVMALEELEKKLAG